MRGGTRLTVDQSCAARIVESPRASTVGFEERAGENGAPLRVGYQLADAFSSKPRVWRHRAEEKQGHGHSGKVTKCCRQALARLCPTQAPGS